LILEVVRQPLVRFNLDAAILFSDILTMLEPMGMEFDFSNGGPVLATPVRTPDDLARLRECDVERDLHFVLSAIRLIKKEIPETPLIGYIGSPITVACYLLEGEGSKTFNTAKQFLHENPTAAERLLEVLTDVASRYLKAQIEAGCDAVQIFDSWGGILSHDDYRRWSASWVNRIFESVADKGVPRILFVNNLAPYVDIVNEIDCEVVGVDYRMSLESAFEAIPDKAVQGNLNPSVLFGEPSEVISQTQELLKQVSSPERFIFNLGHGIQPETPIESVQAMLDTVKRFR
jgi:uroporphyrinogen decarboxylase